MSDALLEVRDVRLGYDGPDVLVVGRCMCQLMTLLCTALFHLLRLTHHLSKPPATRTHLTIN